MANFIYKESMGTIIHKFTQAAADKGYTAAELAKRWGITPRGMLYICANPQPRHWDMLAGLPNKSKGERNDRVQRF